MEVQRRRQKPRHHLAQGRVRRLRLAKRRLHDEHLGQALGCGAHLAGLRRTVSGKFKVSAATPLEELTTLSPDDLARRVVPMLQLSAVTES